MGAQAGDGRIEIGAEPVGRGGAAEAASSSCARVTWARALPVRQDDGPGADPARDEALRLEFAIDPAYRARSEPEVVGELTDRREPVSLGQPAGTDEDRQLGPDLLVGRVGLSRSTSMFTLALDPPAGADD